MQNFGQINRGTELGDCIYNLVRDRVDIKTIVEFGTWNGLGTTKCVIDGLRDDQHFYSIELYPDMYQLALENNRQNLKRSNIRFILGTIVSYNETFWFEHSLIDTNKDAHASLWYQKDMEMLKAGKDVMAQLPEAIDLLILDGGEYSTYPEWVKLRSRTRIVVLDDTATLKCNKIASELTKDASYRCLVNRPNERNGFSVYEKII